MTRSSNNQEHRMENGNSSAVATEGVVGAEEVKAAVADKLAVAKDQAQAMKVKVKEFVDENPVVAVAGAVAAGFLVGRLLSRL